MRAWLFAAPCDRPPAQYNRSVRVDDFLDGVISRLEQQKARLVKAAAAFSDEEWDASRGKRGWSASQIVDHMNLANGFYFEPMRRAVEAAPERQGVEVAFSWFGKVLQKASGPTGKAPSPKKLWPRTERPGRAALDTWMSDADALLKLAQDAKGKDLVRTKLTNPLVGIFRMNLADCFQLLVSHNERHIAQVERRVPGPKA
ncbi:MAG: hypothetical protein AMXMBFR19_10470 [Chthonomonadaceae bacterium]|nr:MAG: DinB family protein [Armatimonadota bacterium]MBL1151519.1 DinB family protein [Armatimonadota bacterium]GIK32823.1 MAG: hypothetical protein BroJett009_18150 [Armatimonadota bacterium]